MDTTSLDLFIQTSMQAGMSAEQRSHQANMAAFDELLQQHRIFGNPHRLATTLAAHYMREQDHIARVFDADPVLLELKRKQQEHTQSHRHGSKAHSKARHKAAHKYHHKPYHFHHHKPHRHAENAEHAEQAENVHAEHSTLTDMRFPGGVISKQGTTPVSSSSQSSRNSGSGSGSGSNVGGAGPASAVAVKASADAEIAKVDAIRKSADATAAAAAAPGDKPLAKAAVAAKATADTAVTKAVAKAAAAKPVLPVLPVLPGATGPANSGATGPAAPPPVVMVPHPSAPSGIPKSDGDDKCEGLCPPDLSGDRDSIAGAGEDEDKRKERCEKKKQASGLRWNDAGQACSRPFLTDRCQKDIILESQCPSHMRMSACHKVEWPRGSGNVVYPCQMCKLGLGLQTSLAKPTLNFAGISGQITFNPTELVGPLGKSPHWCATKCPACLITRISPVAGTILAKLERWASGREAAQEKAAADQPAGGGSVLARQAELMATTRLYPCTLFGHSFLPQLLAPTTSTIKPMKFGVSVGFSLRPSALPQESLTCSIGCRPMSSCAKSEFMQFKSTAGSMFQKVYQTMTVRKLKKSRAAQEAELGDMEDVLRTLQGLEKKDMATELKKARDDMEESDKLGQDAAELNGEKVSEEKNGMEQCMKDSLGNIYAECAGCDSITAFGAATYPVPWSAMESNIMFPLGRCMKCFGTVLRNHFTDACFREGPTQRPEIATDALLSGCTQEGVGMCLVLAEAFKCESAQPGWGKANVLASLGKKQRARMCKVSPRACPSTLGNAPRHVCEALRKVSAKGPDGKVDPEFWNNEMDPKSLEGDKVFGATVGKHTPGDCMSRKIHLYEGCHTVVRSLEQLKQSRRPRDADLWANLMSAGDRKRRLAVCHTIMNCPTKEGKDAEIAAELEAEVAKPPPQTPSLPGDDELVLLDVSQAEADDAGEADRRRVGNRVAAHEQRAVRNSRRLKYRQFLRDLYGPLPISMGARESMFVEVHRAAATAAAAASKFGGPPAGCTNANYNAKNGNKVLTPEEVVALQYLDAKDTGLLAPYVEEPRVVPFVTALSKIAKKEFAKLTTAEAELIGVDSCDRQSSTTAKPAFLGIFNAFSHPAGCAIYHGAGEGDFDPCTVEKDSTSGPILNAATHKTCEACTKNPDLPFMAMNQWCPLPKGSGECQTWRCPKGVKAVTLKGKCMPNSGVAPSRFRSLRGGEDAGAAAGRGEDDESQQQPQPQQLQFPVNEQAAPPGFGD